MLDSNRVFLGDMLHSAIRNRQKDAIHRLSFTPSLDEMLPGRILCVVDKDPVVPKAESENEADAMDDRAETVAVVVVGHEEELFVGAGGGELVGVDVFLSELGQGRDILGASDPHLSRVDGEGQTSSGKLSINSHQFFSPRRL